MQKWVPVSQRISDFGVSILDTTNFKLEMVKVTNKSEENNMVALMLGAERFVGWQ